MSLLEVKDLCRTFWQGDTAIHAVDHVNFSLNKGEMLAIVGQSGSGKTTLLNLLDGVDKPTSGQVLLDGSAAGKSATSTRTSSFCPFSRRRRTFSCPPIWTSGKFRQTRCSSWQTSWASARAWGICPPRCPADSGSGWPLPVPLSISRIFCWRTNPPAIWTKPLPRKSFNCCWT